MLLEHQGVRRRNRPSQRDQCEQAKELYASGQSVAVVGRELGCHQQDPLGPHGPGVPMRDCHERPKSEHQVAYRSTAPMVALRRHRARSQMAGGSVGGLGYTP
jgi:hypothetical protein